jgi:hypothetical protein
MRARYHKVTQGDSPNKVAKVGLSYLFLRVRSQHQRFRALILRRLLWERVNLLGISKFPSPCSHDLGLADDFTLLLLLSEHQLVLICEVSLAIYPEVLFALG